jgi:hypothetical protein
MSKHCTLAVRKHIYTALAVFIWSESTTMAPQITLFVHGITPNPPKVAILLEELGIDYAVENRVGTAH